MFKNLSLIRKTSLAFIALLFLSISFMSALWTYQEYQAFESESALVRKRFVENQNRKLQVEVDKAFSYIEYHRYSARERIKKDLKERVCQACDLAANTLKRYQGRLTRAEMERMVVETLRHMRFWSGRGYYFIFDVKARAVLQTVQPELEGKALKNWRDPKGRFAIREMVSLALKQDEGFYHYDWAKPGGNSDLFDKIAFVKLFKPFGWVIGVGEYLDDASRQTKKDALEGLERITYGKEGYIFAGTWEGYTLLGPAKGKNMLQLTDSKGKKIVQELIAKSKKGGGFVDYVMPPFPGKRPARKVSFVKGIPQWKWYVGAGYYLNDVEKLITRQEKLLEKKLKDKLFNIFMLFVFSLVAVLVLARAVSHRVAKQFEVFKSFFQKAASDLSPIDPDKLGSRDFKELAASANFMVAERSRLEEEKRRMEHQLLQSQKMEALGTLAGGIAHDFNNVLASVMGYAELAVQKCRSGKQVDHELAQVLSAAERAKALVRQILTFGRKMEPELKPLDLNREILHDIRLLKNLIPKMVSIETRLADDLRLVMGDANQLEQVLINLCSNANDAMPQGGRLLVETANVKPKDLALLGNAVSPGGEYVFLRVTDSGQGMNAKILERIFEPFFTTKEVGRGTGLGLSTVFGIIKSHGGHITCQSKEGEGSVFTVFLKAMDRLPVQKPAKENQDDWQVRGEGHLLLVDDESAFLAILEDALSSSGYRVSAASSGEEALEIYRQNQAGIDLVIMDVGMPGMGGHRCLEEIKKLNPQAKVIISSGYAPDAGEKSALKLGAAAFIAKPFKLAELNRLIRKVLD